MLREGKGSLTPVGYHSLGRVYPRDRLRAYFVPHERTTFQKAPEEVTPPQPDELLAAYERIHTNDLFAGPDHRWVYPMAMGAPEYATYIREDGLDEDCHLRRPDEDEMCLRRPVETETQLRRAPECPEQFACPNEGCV